MEFSKINSYFLYFQNHLVIMVCRFLPPSSHMCTKLSLTSTAYLRFSETTDTVVVLFCALFVGGFSFLASHLSLFQPFPASLLTDLNWMQPLPALLCLSSPKSLCLNFGEAISQSF